MKKRPTDLDSNPTHDIIVIIVLVRSATFNTANTVKPLSREFLHYYLLRIPRQED